MKILVPYKDIARRRIDDPVVSGGIERFIRNLLLNIDGVEVMDITDVYHNPELVAKHVGAAAEEFDLVICNYPNRGLNVGLREQTSTPIAWICHHTVGLDPQWRSVALNMVALSKTPGFSLWMVSQHQLDGWAKEFNPIYDACKGFIPPGFARPAKVFESTYDCVTVGRCQKMKDPFLCHRIAKGYDLVSWVLTNSTGNPADAEYEAEGKNKFLPPKQNTLWNGSDDNVREIVSRASCYIVTWPGETFGIAALEALSYGVPLVMVTDKDNHACTALIDNIDGGCIVHENDVRDVIEIYRRHDLRTRQRLAARTYMKFGLAPWVDTIKAMTEKAVQ